MNAHKEYLVFEKKQSNLKCNYYNWNDELYSVFMMGLLRCLEPRKIQADVIIYDELDDFTEVRFIHSGKVKIGFHLNHKQYYALMKQNGFVIGDHGCTFNHKSCFIYRSHTVCDGFFIRK